MGDRANIVIEQDNCMFPSPVFFYTRWSGSDIKPTLQKALIRGRPRPRWNDSAYLARIIFNQMTDGSEMDETGFGISTSCSDGDGRCLFVNIEQKIVRSGSWVEEKADYDGQKWTFEEFVSAKFEGEES